MITFNDFYYMSVHDKANFINSALGLDCPVWAEKLQSAIVSQSTRPLLFFIQYPVQYRNLIESFHEINEVNYHHLRSINQI
jgi:hypothetical protein